MIGPFDIDDKARIDYIISLINIFQLSIYVQINNDIGFTAKEIKKKLIVLSLYICFDVFKINVNVWFKFFLFDFVKWKNKGNHMCPINNLFCSATPTAFIKVISERVL